MYNVYNVNNEYFNRMKIYLSIHEWVAIFYFISLNKI